MTDLEIIELAARRAAAYTDNDEIHGALKKFAEEILELQHRPPVLIRDGDDPTPGAINRM